MPNRPALTVTIALGLVVGAVALLRPVAGLAQSAASAQDARAADNKQRADCQEAGQKAKPESARTEGDAVRTDAASDPKPDCTGTTLDINQTPQKAPEKDSGEGSQKDATQVTQKAVTQPAAILHPYKINSSAEVGWRFKGTDGSVDKFRSDWNYDRGMRLLSSDLVMSSNNGGGVLFDNLLATSFGIGGDPSQYFRVEADKARWYRFDGSYRRIAYFNDLLNLALNQHIADTTYEIGDFDLTLLPTHNENFRVYLGYSLDNQKGNTTTTYDYSKNEFPILAPTNTHANDYRIGVDYRLWIFDLSFLQGFRFFKDDTSYFITQPTKGNSSGSAFLNTFHRDIPTRGDDPFTRFSLHTLVNKKVDFTGRFIYASATTDFHFLETVTGTDSSGNKVILDRTNVTGDAKRPNAIGDAGVSYFANDRLTISDTFRVNSFRINGGNHLAELVLNSTNNVPNPPIVTDMLSFQLLSYRVWLNGIEGDYRVNKRFAFHLGYRHTDRRDVRADYTIPPGGNLVSPPDQNSTDSVFGGFRARPFDPWTVWFDFEHGASDNVFTRIANYNYNNFRVRNLIKPTKNLVINASFLSRDNDNPALAPLGNAEVPFGVHAKARIFSSSVDWAPNPRFSLSSGYTYSHVSSDAAIVVFLDKVETPGTSLYFVRDNFFFVTAHAQVLRRVGLFGGFRINKDTGQGDRLPASTTEFISSYPMYLLSPEARLSINIYRWLDWNAGWQFFDYDDRFFPVQGYHAQTGYLSLTLRFNRE